MFTITNAFVIAANFLSSIDVDVAARYVEDTAYNLMDDVVAAIPKVEYDETVYFDPTLEPQMGSAVSEFVWAMQKLDDVCDQSPPQDISDMCQAAGESFYHGVPEGEKGHTCFDVNNLENIPAFIPWCGKQTALNIGASIQHVFEQALGNAKPCDMNVNYTCHEIEYNQGRNVATFAFPNQPA
jgi:hypothetical protein